MDNTAFRAHRISRTYRQSIKAPPEKVFPLLCPVREAEWLDGWRYHMIYSESGLVEKGAVFSTQNAGEAETIWVVTRYDSKKKQIEFTRFTHKSRVCVLSIALKPQDKNNSYVDISYTYTSTTSSGNAFVENFTEEAFLKAVRFWEDSMNYYLETGERLRRSL
jgi:hypothetical protein